MRFLLISLAFVLGSVLMVTTASGAHDRLIGLVCLVIFASMLAMCLAMGFRRSAILTVDRAGLHAPRRTPVDIGWDEVVAVSTYWISKRAVPQLKIRMLPDAYARYVDRLPGAGGAVPIRPTHGLAGLPHAPGAERRREEPTAAR